MFIGKVPIFDQIDCRFLNPQGLYFEINTLLNAKNGWKVYATSGEIWPLGKNLNEVLVTVSPPLSLSSLKLSGNLLLSRHWDSLLYIGCWLKKKESFLRNTKVNRKKTVHRLVGFLGNICTFEVYSSIETEKKVLEAY